MFSLSQFVRVTITNRNADSFSRSHFYACSKYADNIFGLFNSYSRANRGCFIRLAIYYLR